MTNGDTTRTENALKNKNMIDEEVKMKIEEVAKKLGKLIVEIGIYFLRSWVIMLLWNAVATKLFYVPTLTFWYAVGLNLLTGQLFRFRKSYEIED